MFGVTDGEVDVMVMRQLVCVLWRTGKAGEED
jgi:hypothetical protein